MLKCVKRLLQQHAYEPILFSSAQAFKSHTDFEKAACVILDINLNDGSGIELRHGLKAAGVSVPVIYITGNEDPAVRKAALASGCIAFLTKPFSAQSLIEPLKKHRQGVPRLRSLVDGLIKVCTCMSAIGTLETCRRHPRMSVNRETGSDRPTAKPSLLTQNSPNQRCRSCIARRGRCKRWVAVPSVASKEANATTVACLRCRDHEID